MFRGRYSVPVFLRSNLWNSTSYFHYRIVQSTRFIAEHPYEENFCPWKPKPNICVILIQQAIHFIQDTSNIDTNKDACYCFFIISY
mmetsp:Transcript_1379/g.2878  ORF Transcript_1379/g.2878 Transcript_1379/m.2878 type:complete len:86 (+) Transcript_1379:329-586(+)